LVPLFLACVDTEHHSIYLSMVMESHSTHGRCKRDRKRKGAGSHYLLWGHTTNVIRVPTIFYHFYHLLVVLSWGLRLQHKGSLGDIQDPNYSILIMNHWSALKMNEEHAAYVDKSWNHGNWKKTVTKDQLLQFHLQEMFEIANI
jgi:hypothetical protein